MRAEFVVGELWPRAPGGLLRPEAQRGVHRERGPERFGARIHARFMAGSRARARLSFMEHADNKSSGGGRAYLRFGAMIATSVAVMLGLTYVNTYAADHVYWSETRFYMALMMGAAMAVVMLSFMLHMHKDRRINAAIYSGAVVVFAVAVYLVRSQATVGQVSYMRAMIPHHSIAILTSERAEITDPRVRELADGIIKTQREEIAEMKRLIEDLEAKREE